MKRWIARAAHVVAILATVLWWPNADADPAREQPRARDGSGGATNDAFGDVYRVLLSPRCRNCHPAGDAPLQRDQGVPHAQNVTRRSAQNGLPCSSCHRSSNAPIPGGPPGVEGWQLPPAHTPMVFAGRTPRQLCQQLKDPRATGGRTLADLVDHVTRDHFVLWAWHPGPGRSKPPLSHRAFVTAFRRWVDAGGPCPPR